MNEASRNVGAARTAADRGDWGEAWRILRHGEPNTSPGDSYYPPETSPGDSYPPVTSPGDGAPYYPYNPPQSPPVPNYPPQPSYNVDPGWYPDPFDGIGYRWWNGQGWTPATQG